MAEITTPQGSGKRKVQAPRIDLTPMVDLGFLLITFFMYTTTLAKPNAMAINMPAESNMEYTPVVAESALTVIPVGGHQIVYYEGILNSPDQMKICAANGLCEILIAKKKEVVALPTKFSPTAHRMYVLIKPGDDCSYGDLVGVLDEMNIVDVPYYTIVDITKEETDWILGKF